MLCNSSNTAAATAAAKGRKVAFASAAKRPVTDVPEVGEDMTTENDPDVSDDYDSDDGATTLGADQSEAADALLGERPPSPEVVCSKGDLRGFYGPLRPVPDARLDALDGGRAGRRQVGEFARCPHSLLSVVMCPECFGLKKPEARRAASADC